MTSSSPVGFLSDLSATEAFENLKSNRHARWPDRHEPTNRVEPMCAPHFAAPFPITPGASVFTIGSCFARNVEKGLIKLGFDVPARRAVGAGVDANVLNTFTANSMLNEVTWALDQNAPFDPAQHFYDMGGDKVADLHLGKRWTHPVARETALLRRAHVTQAYANLAQCRMLILTLGLAEA